MAKPIVVVGAGGFGRETLDVIDAVNAHAERPLWHILAVYDDAPSPENLLRLQQRGVEYGGSVQDLVDRAVPEISYVVAIGAPQVRRRIVAILEKSDLRAATLIHPDSSRGFGVEIGEGTIICAGARLTTNIRIGKHTHLNPNVTIGHDSVLGNFVSLNPASSVSGDCQVSDAVLVGVGAVILNQLVVGEGATVGAAACVVRDVAAGLTVKGVPAR